MAIQFGVGAHEPIYHRLRTGNSTAEEWQRWNQEVSPENLDLLCRLGVTDVHIACTKGFGLEYEKPVIERAARFAERALARGIRTGVYVQGFPVYYETFLLECPQAEGWLARQQDGDYIPWGGQTFRRWMDPARREFWDYQRRLLTYVFEQFRFHIVYMDNTIVPIWYGQASLESFRQYLRDRYQGDEILRQFGLPSFDAVDLPRFDPIYFPRDAYQIVKDPLLQEWARWRSWIQAQYLREMRELIHRLSPPTQLVASAGGCDGLRYNQLFIHGVDYEDRLEVLDLGHMEESWWRPGVVEQQPSTAVVVKDERHPDQAAASQEPTLRVSTDSRWWKIAGEYGWAGHGAIWGELDRASKLVALSHNLAFAANADNLGTIAPLAADPRMFDDIRDVIDWAGQNEDVLTGRRQRYAPVALWRGTSTIGFIRHRPVWEACAVEQLLYEQHVPFTILLDGGLERFLAGRKGPPTATYCGWEPRVLVLPGTACMSDRQVEVITEFVSGGGGLLLLGPAGTRDERTRLRRRYAFEHLFSGQVPSLEHFGPPHWVPELDFSAMPERLSGQLGRGRVELVARIEPHGPLDLARDPYMPERMVRSADIVPPANEAAILAALERLLPPGAAVRARGPRWTLCEYWQRERDLLVCLANLRQGADGGPVELDLGPLRAEKVRVRSLFDPKPPTAAPQELPVRDGRVRIDSVPHFVAVEIPATSPG